MFEAQEIGQPSLQLGMKWPVIREHLGPNLLEIRFDLFEIRRLSL